MIWRQNWWWNKGPLELSRNAGGLLHGQLPLRSLPDPDVSVAERAFDRLTVHAARDIKFAGENYNITIVGAGCPFTQVPGVVLRLAGAIELDHFGSTADLPIGVDFGIAFRQILVKPACVALHGGDSQLIFEVLNGFGDIRFGCRG